MKKRSFLFPVLCLVVLASLLYVNVLPAAAEEPTPLDISGIVVSIDELTRSFVVETEDAQQFTIFAPPEFDLTALAVGDKVALAGSQNEDGSIAATTITIIVELQLSGSVASISPLEGSFVLGTEDGQTYIVYPSEGFDWTGLAPADLVELSGTLNEDGSVQMISITIPDGTGEDEVTRDSFYCTQVDQQHPIGAILAERYQVDYATLQTWNCAGLGWGQIFLALQTGQALGGEPSAMLAARISGSGWGQIWQEVGKKGNPNDLDGDGHPDQAGSPEDENGPTNRAGDPHAEDEGISENRHGNPHTEGEDSATDGTGNPNDLDGDGHPDQAHPNKPHKHNR